MAENIDNNIEFDESKQEATKVSSFNELKDTIKATSKELIKESAKISSSFKNINKVVRNQLKEANRDVVTFGANLNAELIKDDANFNKLIEKAKELKEKIETLSSVDPQVLKSFEPMISKIQELIDKTSELNQEQTKNQIEDQIKAQGNLITKINESNKSYKDLSNILDELYYSNRDFNKSFDETLKQFPTHSDKIKSLSLEQSNTISKTQNIIDNLDFSNIDKQVTTNSTLISRFNDKIKNLEDQGLDNNDPLIQGLKLMKGNIEVAQASLEEFQELINKTPSLKIDGNIEKFTKDIPVLGKLIKNVTGPLQEGMTKAFKEGTTGAAAFTAGLQNVKKVGLQALFVLFVESLFAVNQQITDLQKNLGISSSQAQNMRAEFAQTAANANDIFINSTKIQTAFTDFSAELGMAVENSGTMLETFANLTGRFGLNNQEAAKLTSVLGLQNRDTEQVLENTIKTINASRSSGKEFFNTKEIIKDISNISNNVIASLGRSPDILSRAATKARELGLNLNQVENIADSLLNFESSISAELTAELLTGKQLNLERARFLALNNSIEELMEEINKQGINFTEFTKMGRIAQEALANTLGMNRDTMTEMLFNQEKQELARKDANGELDKQTSKQFKALSAQQNFNEALEKSKTAFADLVIVFSPMIDLLGLVAQGVTFLLKPLQVIGNIINSINNKFGETGKFITTLVVGAGLLTVALKKAAIMSFITSAALNPVGAFLKVGAAIAAAYLAQAAIDSITAKPMAKGGPITAGNPYLVGEEGPELIVPNSSGQVINNNALNALTSPSPTINMQSLVEPNPSPTINMQPLIDRLDKLERTLVEYRSVPVVIENNIDGRELNRNTINGLRKGYLTTPSVYV